MSSTNIRSSEAYRLIHDPTRLLELLYSKYGDIEEDYNSLHINQLLYNKTSHYLIVYKEYQYLYFVDEFLKRFYHRSESIERLPKLSEYYKNYHLFFCRPIFRDWTLTELMHNYGDNQAEIFYKNNYANGNNESSTSKKKEETTDNDVNNYDDNSLSSLDNLTNNKTIFDKRTRVLIDSYSKNKGSVTITLENSKLNGNNLLSTKRSKNNSFVKLISGLLAPKEQNIKVNVNSKHEKIKSVRMKSSLCTLTKGGKIEVSTGANQGSGNKILLSPKLKPYLTSFKSNIGEFNKNKPKGSNHNFQTIHTKNKTYFYNGGNNIPKMAKLSSSNIRGQNSIMIMTINNNNRLSTNNINGFSSSKSKKNKTYEFNIFNTNQASKSKNKQSHKLNLKSPISSITNRNKMNGRLHPSTSIPKYNSINNNNPITLNKKVQLTKSKSKKKNTSLSKSNNMSYTNMIFSIQNRKHKYIVQSQRSTNTNNTSNGMKSPTVTHRNNSNSNNEGFNSRNKPHKNSMQSVRSIKNKSGSMRNYNTNAKTTITKSVDEKGKRKSSNNAKMSNKLISQIEELIKKAKFTTNMHSIKVNGKLKEDRGGVFKPINVNINANMIPKDNNRKYIRVGSPKI